MVGLQMISSAVSRAVVTSASAAVVVLILSNLGCSEYAECGVRSAECGVRQKKKCK